ncbi:MAG: ATP synthase F0 subunit B [Bryobacteraceae bacterium]|nr:ATP synthase F0 subunit B [Bryobacteraceae bacterium]
MKLVLALALILTPVFAAEESHGGAHAEPSIAWKWANFAILAGVLGYLINKHAGAFFRSRTAEIQAGITEAAKMRESAERQAADVEKRVANLEAEIAAIRAGAREEMHAEAARFKQETEKTIARLHSQAEFEIASATKLAAAELKQRAAQLAVELAAGEIRQRLNPAAQDKLVSGFVSQLARQQAPQ